jgi:hypothetical protein
LPVAGSTLASMNHLIHDSRYDSAARTPAADALA